MLKIRRSEDQGRTLFTFSGRIDEEHVSELRELLDGDTKGAEITLDLKEVKLADRGSVRFLAACEARGIRLQNCPPYIREWIARGRDRD